MKKSKNSLIKYLFIVSAFFVAVPVLASQFSFDTQNKTVSVGEQFKVDLNINTEKENINAIEGKILFSTSTLELSEIRSGNSVVNFWVDKPVFTNGGIIFSGITPGGYVLDKGLILSLIFTAKKEGNTTIKIENTSALKNDGMGTPSKVITSNLQLNISNATQTQAENLNITDKDAPDVFNPEVAQDPNLFNNKWFVVFVAQDKGTGIASYAVKESRYNIFDFSKWIATSSPYLLVDQELHSNIFVKAIDNAGNERVVKLSPKNPLAWYANIEIWFIIVLVIAVALIYFSLSKKKKNQ